MRPWRDIISAESFRRVLNRKIDQVVGGGATGATMMALQLLETHAKELLRQIEDYHGIVKDDLAFFDPRIERLEAISALAGSYWENHVSDKVAGAARVRANGMPLQKSEYHGNFNGGNDAQQSLERAVLTLRNRGLRKAEYLRTLQRYYEQDGNLDPRSLLAMLSAPQDRTDTTIGIVPGVRLEANDPYHRPYEVHTNGQGHILPAQGLNDDYSISTALYNWFATLNTHQLPFFVWLETSAICVGGDRALIAATRSVTYARPGATIPNMKMVTFIDGAIQMSNFGEAILAPCSTADYISAERKGGNGAAAFAWTAVGELYIGQHQESVFHHSSFAAGGHVRCAGMIKIANNRVSFVSNNSGHYKPPKTNLKTFIDWLKTHNAIDQTAQVLCLGQYNFEGTLADFERGFSWIGTREPWARGRSNAMNVRRGFI
jgi:hypothetical protein